MRFRLLRRRLTISAPRMAIRSALPWPLRWLAAAVMLGLCAAVALWVFELGRSIAGPDRQARAELAALRAEVAQLRAQRDQMQQTDSAANSLLTAERSASEKLAGQIRQLEADNRALRDDLGFFEALMPATGSAGLGIRGLQAEAQEGGQMRWQVLVIQAMRNAPAFEGRLELTFTGTTADGHPWRMDLPGGPQLLQLRQYRRMEGVFIPPANVVVKSVSAKIMDGTTTRAEQSATIQSATS
ncbi:MAG TPA: DUF6776 family protein [Burkholderiaceae bacterium]